MKKFSFTGFVAGFALGTLVIQGVILPNAGVRTFFCHIPNYPFCWK